jgi:hypothetical protein
MKSNSEMYKKVMRLLEGSKDESLLEELRENEGDLMDYLTEEMPERKGSVMIMIKKGKKGDDLEEMFPEKDNSRMKFPEFKRGGEVKKKKPKITFKKKKGFGTKWENKWG